jgi:hypothetical protein
MLNVRSNISSEGSCASAGMENYTGHISSPAVSFIESLAIWFVLYPIPFFIGSPFFGNRMFPLNIHT